MYNTEDLNVRSRMEDVVRAIQALPAVSRLSQHHNRYIFSPEPTGCGGRLRYGASLRQLQGMGTKKVVLSADNDNEFRSRCK